MPCKEKFHPESRPSLPQPPERGGGSEGPRANPRDEIPVLIYAIQAFIKQVGLKTDFVSTYANINSGHTVHDLNDGSRSSMTLKQSKRVTLNVLHHSDDFAGTTDLKVTYRCCYIGSKFICSK